MPEVVTNPADLVPLYRPMVLTRAAKAIALQRTDRHGTFASSLGQEVVGAARAMATENVGVPSFSDQAAQPWRGSAPVECCSTRQQQARQRLRRFLSTAAGRREARNVHWRQLGPRGSEQFRNDPPAFGSGVPTTGVRSTVDMSGRAAFLQASGPVPGLGRTGRRCRQACHRVAQVPV